MKRYRLILLVSALSFLLSKSDIPGNLFHTEHEPPGAERVKLPDTVDRDEVDDLDDPPSMVCYFIVFGNENGTFHLEPDTHILTVVHILNVIPINYKNPKSSI